MAIGSVQSYPLYIYDLVDRKVINEFDVGNWYAGPRVDYSAGGKYLLLQQFFFIDFAQNKDRQVNFEIVDAATGKRLLHFEKCHSLVISRDEKFAVSLIDKEVSFWSLPDGKKLRSHIFPEATNSIQLSPDGQYLLISLKPDADKLKKDSRFKKNKKSRKLTAKYKQQISIYDAATFKYIKTVDDFFDIIYRLSYSNDGNYLFCLNIPHTKLKTSVATFTAGARQNFISVVDVANNYQVTRKIFPSSSAYEPEFKLSPNGKYFGLISMGKFPEIHLYDFETGRMEDRYELSYRLFENWGKGDLPTDGRVEFDFMDDNQSIIMTMGNSLVLWKFKQ